MTETEGSESPIDLLPAIERDTLVVLALLYEPTSRSATYAALGATDVRMTRTRRVTSEDLRPWFARWAENGFVVESPDGFVVRDGIVAPLLDDAARRGRLDKLYEYVASTTALKRSRDYAHGIYAERVFIPELQVFLATGRADRVTPQLDLLMKRVDKGVTRADVIVAAIGFNPPGRWLEAFAHADRSAYLVRVADLAVAALLPIPPHLSTFFARQSGESGIAARLAMIETLSGGRGPAFELIRTKPDLESLCARVVDASLDGRFAEALVLADLGLATQKRKKYRLLPGIAGVLHVVALFAQCVERPTASSEIEALLVAATATKSEHLVAYAALHELLTRSRATHPLAKDRDPIAGYSPCSSWIDTYTRAFVLASLDMKASRPDFPKSLDSWSVRARRHGFGRLSAEFHAVAQATRGETTSAAAGLLSAYRPRPAWETVLDRLLCVAQPTVPRLGPTTESPHLVWELAFGEDAVSISPRLVEAGASRAKPIAVSTLLRTTPAYLTQVDRRVLEHAFEDKQHYASGYAIGRSALVVLVGHPHVARSGMFPVELVRGEVQLVAETVDGGVRVRLDPPISESRRVVHREESARRVVVFEGTVEQVALAKILGPSGATIPNAGVERLSRVLGALAPVVPVQSSVDVALEADEIEPDPRPVLVVHRESEALRFEVRVAPLGLDGPMLATARGSGVLVGTIGGRPMRTRRDLEAERRALDALERVCPAFVAAPSERDDRVARDLESQYEILLELHALADTVVIVYPGGRPIAPPKRVEWAGVRFRVREASGLLDVDANLEVDEGRVLCLRELLEAKRASVGRFIKLDDGTVLALADELRQRLAVVEILGKLEGDSVRTSPLALDLLDDLGAGAKSSEFDAESRARLERMRRALASRPKLPRGLSVELREYQREGFEFLARLAEAGLGACLADDMGLGKTIQALVLLAHRAKVGPAIVVAPTSVIAGWFDAATRFTPRLRFHALGGERDALVAGLRGGDVLVCTYGTLGTVSELAEGKRFATIVFDEAHLLKNARTQRARAARSIDADARIALSGTPVENHLGELHSLFHAIVPGLLGTEGEFAKRFSGPIASGDREIANVLRRVIRPFVLRRTKSEVLSELPPRTESTRLVEPSDDEAAFYEAVRRNAVERLAAAKAEPIAQARVRILAEILRLRQASIDPRLIDPECGIVGSKIEALEALLDEALDEGHRVLVFSQFLGSLALVRDVLRRRGIAHFELDGSTLPAERARRIDAFQAGEGDVFLMSLKAGGVGVNLTGADYVVHLDPWWNPAVEDQASDRAHRMGQTKPVTIYRLVTRGSIEEKILALHGQKRALADDLLAGLDSAAPIDLATMRGLVGIGE